MLRRRREFTPFYHETSPFDKPAKYSRSKDLCGTNEGGKDIDTERTRELADQHQEHGFVYRITAGAKCSQLCSATVWLLCPMGTQRLRPPRGLQ